MGALRGQHQRRVTLTVLPVNDVRECLAENLDAVRIAMRGRKMQRCRAIGVDADSRRGIIARTVNDGGARVMAKG